MGYARKLCIDHVFINGCWIFKMQEVGDNIYLLIIIGMFGTALLVVTFILINIRNRNKLLRQQRKAHHAVIQHQKDLLHATITSQEEERRRIGSDLHDEVGSVLSSLRMYIQKFTEENDLANATEFGTKSKSMIDSIITNTRNISHDLSPITGGAYSIMDALEDLCSQVNLSDKPEISLSASKEDMLSHLNLNHALALYRVIRELVKNTITHARANSIIIDITEEKGQFLILYKDDGNGMLKKMRNKGMGMNNIESRLNMIGAGYNITTSPGKGFEISISVPAK
jgi:signal transduction histidine kinase